MAPPSWPKPWVASGAFLSPLWACPPNTVGLAGRVAADGARERTVVGWPDLTVLLVTAEGVAVRHVAVLPHAGAADLGQGEVGVEVRPLGRQDAAFAGAQVAGGLGGAGVGQELDL